MPNVYASNIDAKLQVQPCLDLLNSRLDLKIKTHIFNSSIISLILLTEDERIEYEKLLNIASTFTKKELDEIARHNYSIIGLGECPTILDEFKQTKFAKEIIPGCIETCTRLVLIFCF